MERPFESEWAPESLRAGVVHKPAPGRRPRLRRRIAARKAERKIGIVGPKVPHAVRKYAGRSLSPPARQPDPNFKLPNIGPNISGNHRG